MGYAYPIDSKVVTNPNGTVDYDRASSSAQLRGLIKSMITNGVNLTESTNLQVMADEETMNLVVKPGYVIIEGALKHFEDDVKVTIGAADTTNPRIDTVVARLNLNEDVRDIVIDVLQGTPAAEPMAPELTRTTSYYEVGLADILIEVGATQISQAVVTDTRLLNSRCGMISAIGEIDTETLFNQLTTDFDNWFESIKGKLGDDVAGDLQMQIDGLADDIDTLQEDVEALEEDSTTLQNDVEKIKDTLGYSIGKNLLNHNTTTYTSSGITRTVNDDKSITLSGTATSNINLTLTSNITIPNGDYILSGYPGGNTSVYKLYLVCTDGTEITDNGNGVRFTVSDERKISSAYIYINKGANFNTNLTIYPMIRKADVTDDTYEPYAPTVDARLDTVESALEWKLVGSGETVTLTDTIINNAKEIMVLNYGKVQTSGVYWQVATTHIIPKEMMTQIISIYNSSTSYQVVRFFFSYNNDKTVPMYYDIPNKKFTSTNSAHTLYVYYR